MKLNLYENDAKIMLDEAFSITSANEDYYEVQCEVRYEGKNSGEDCGIEALFDFLDKGKKSNKNIKNFAIKYDKNEDVIVAYGYNSYVTIRTKFVKGVTTKSGAVTYDVSGNCTDSGLDKVKELLQSVNSRRVFFGLFKRKKVDLNAKEIAKLSNEVATTDDRYALINISKFQVLDTDNKDDPTKVSAKKAEDIYDGIITRLSGNKGLVSEPDAQFQVVEHDRDDKGKRDPKTNLTVYTDIIQFKYMSRTISFRDIYVEIKRIQNNNLNKNGTDTNTTYSVVMTAKRVPFGVKTINDFSVNFLYIIFGFIGEDGLGVGDVEVEGNAYSGQDIKNEIKKAKKGTSGNSGASKNTPTKAKPSRAKSSQKQSK